jgi:kynurenine 3-monooxygenase
MSARRSIAIVGGGPAGSLLAILLARRGLAPVVLERSAKFSETAASAGRSINLALAARGIAALREAGIERAVGELLIPMRGRMLHDQHAVQRFLAYGQRAGEQIYSVSRAALNTLLYRLASEQHGVEYRFEHRCIDVDVATGQPLLQTPRGVERLDADVVLAADGAGSEVRRALAAARIVTATEELLDHGYKELTIPASGAESGFVFEPHALHIWPRGGFMLIALPNIDGSFTATLFLPHRGTPSFASVGVDARGFFAREFPDALAVMPEVELDYRAHSIGVLGTVHCRPWSLDGRVLLVGDAAHAIVPFHGQGMNAAFEDCIALDRRLGAALATGGAPDWRALFRDFERERAPNALAIAEMAIENYREMRDDVRDPRFELRAAVSFELERRFPGRFIPRYSMVMFHPEIPYAEAQRRGAIQARIVDELTANATALGNVDFARAARRVEAEL